MNKQDYQEYLQTPYWKRRALDRKIDASFICEDCGGCFRYEEDLHVHHLSYEGVPYRELDSELIVLCDRCHKHRHGLLSEEQEESEESYNERGGGCCFQRHEEQAATR